MRSLAATSFSLRERLLKENGYERRMGRCAVLRCKKRRFLVDSIYFVLTRPLLTFKYLWPCACMVKVKPSTDK